MLPKNIGSCHKHLEMFVNGRGISVIMLHFTKNLV